MPTIDHKLASQRLQVQGGHRGLNPVLFDTSAAGHIRAPQIDPNAANVHYTPVQPGQVGIKTPLEATAEGASKLMEVWGNAATQYAEQQHELDATLAVDKIQAVYDMYLNGHTDTMGKYIPGYLDTAENEARQGYSAFVQQLDQGTMEILQGLPEGARAKAAIRAGELRRQATNTAVMHRRKEEISLQKRAYGLDAEQNTAQLANDILGMLPYGTSIAKLSEDQKKQIHGVLSAGLNKESQRRWSAIGYGPNDADPNSDPAVDLMRYLYSTNDPHAAEVAEDLWATLEPLVDNLDGREKVQDAMREYYKSLNERDRQKVERDALNYKLEAIQHHDTVYKAVVSAAKSGDPRQLAEIRETFAHNPEMQSNINSWASTLSATTEFNPERTLAISNAMAKNLTPRQLITELAENKWTITPQELEKFETGYRTNINTAITKIEERTVDRLEGLLRSEKDAVDAQGNSMLVMLDDVKESPRWEELKAEYREDIRNFVQTLKIQQGNELSTADLDAKVNTYYKETLLPKLKQDLVNASKPGAVKSTVPDAMRLLNQKNVQGNGNIPGLAQASNPIDALWALKPFLGNDYIWDPKLRAAVTSIVRGKSPDRARKIYQQYVDKGDQNAIKKHNDLLAAAYRSIQRTLLEDNGILDQKEIDQKMQELDTDLKQILRNFEATQKLTGTK